MIYEKNVYYKMRDKKHKAYKIRKTNPTRQLLLDAFIIKVKQPRTK